MTLMGTEVMIRGRYCCRINSLELELLTSHERRVEIPAGRKNLLQDSSDAALESCEGTGSKSECWGEVEDGVTECLANPYSSVGC